LIHPFEAQHLPVGAPLRRLSPIPVPPTFKDRPAAQAGRCCHISFPWLSASALSLCHLHSTRAVIAWLGRDFSSQQREPATPRHVTTRPFAPTLFAPLRSASHRVALAITITIAIAAAIMGSSSRKRSRSVVEENRAECPFKVTIVANPPRTDRDRQKTKRQKRDETDEDKKIQIQMSPFSPTGKFKTHETMDLHYTVEPSAQWLEMTRYNSFVLNGTKYYSEGFVYVANDATIERQRGASAAENGGQFRKAEDDWVARILEIRAADEHHVYARVNWMYSPDELPKGTLDGKKLVEGRQPYHGQNELVASNHMDVINVVSVTMPAVVNQWIETDDDEIQDALYWRQAFDCRNSQLSAVELICKCETPANPDKTLIGCTNSACGKWLHYQCLLEDVLARTFERLGNDKPHIDEGTVVKKEDKEEERAARPLSPTETREEETQPTIDVRGGEASKDAVVKQANGDAPKPTETPVSGHTTPAPETSKTASEKKARRKSKADSKPYQNLFDAALKMDDGPTVWEIKDLRPNVSGGESTWTEKPRCLCCGVAID
jgi:hypothetical protein